jgi:hypothetical protein
LYQTGKGTSVIDLAFTLQALHDSIIIWAVDDDASTVSDHTTIRFDIVTESELVITDSNTIRFNCNKID